METIIYVPTEEEKADITLRCNKMIDALSGLRVEQKAFALNMIMSSFEDLHNVKLTAIHSEEQETR